MKELAFIFDIKVGTLQKLYKQWQEDPSFYYRICKLNNKDHGPSRKLTLQRLEHINRLIK